jgi:hypothetical protein
MATNLVSVIMKFLTPDMIGRIASALGLDRNDASSAVEAGVPALLASFAGVAARPGGPQKLADAAKQEINTLDKLPGMVGAAGTKQLPSAEQRCSRRSLAAGTRPHLKA